MPQDLSAKGTIPESLKKEKFLNPAKPSGAPNAFADHSQLDAVFSGGYYVVLSGEESSPSSWRNTRSQQKYNKKSEEALQLANVTRQLAQQLKAPSEAAEVEASPRETVPPHYERHEKLLEEIQTLIGKSDFVHSSHEMHLKDEIVIAREQLLRGGAIDDYALMQTLQEIADLQGFSLGGSTMAGRFSSDILDPPEPAVVQAEQQVATIPIIPPVVTMGIFERDRQEYIQREFEQFSSYDISEVGGLGDKNSLFFAKKVMDGLIEVDTRSQPEQAPLEIVP